MKYVFLDRDGTVVADENYNNYRSVLILPEAIPALLIFRDMGFSLAIVSNQSGIGRGIVDEQNLIAQNTYLAAALAERGIAIERFSYCPHTSEENCQCRKPLPGMLLQHAADFQNSWMIGDKPSDVECGERAGCRSLLIRRDFNLFDAAQHIVRHINGNINLTNC